MKSCTFLITKLFLLMMIACILGSCTVLYLPYFRNITSEKVVLFCRSNIKGEIKNENNVAYKNKVIEINRFTKNRLKDSLPIEFHNSGVYIIVPPKSTVGIQNLSIRSLNDTILIINYSDYVKDMPKITVLDTITISDFNYKGYFSKPYQKFDYAK